MKNIFGSSGKPSAHRGLRGALLPNSTMRGMQKIQNVLTFK